MSFHKRIVVDYDDTISFANNRDWANASPNVKLIQKINSLFEDGWQIDIFTARGSISCKTREEAKEKYLEEMETWLVRHGVKYSSISFEKPLAAYYIDDKAITPDEFVDRINIQQLHGGLSGSDIFTDGQIVHKTDSRAHLVKDWYLHAKNINLSVPRIDRVVGSTLSLEYIHHNPNFFEENLYLSLGLIQETLYKMKHSSAMNNLLFSTYTDRIAGHIAQSKPLSQFSVILEKLKDISINEDEFSHGDFGVTNFLFNEEKRELFLIDPIPDVFSSNALDSAKLIASLYVNQYDIRLINTVFNALLVYNHDLHKNDLNTLVISEIIRIYKYHHNKQLILDNIDYVFKSC